MRADWSWQSDFAPNPAPGKAGITRLFAIVYQWRRATDAQRWPSAPEHQMSKSDVKKSFRELERQLGFPPSTFVRDNLLLLLSVGCTVALYAFYESAPPATPGRLNPPLFA